MTSSPNWGKFLQPEDEIESVDLVRRELFAPEPSSTPQPPYLAIYDTVPPEPHGDMESEDQSQDRDLTQEEPEAPPPASKPQSPISPKKEMRWKSAIRNSHLLMFTITGIVIGSGVLLWHGTPIHEIELWVFSMIALLGLIAVPLQDFLYRRR